MRLSNKIVLASTNRGKFIEFTELFASYPEIELVPAEAILRNPGGLAFVETHDTYLENAIAKARLANQGAHYPCLADDSGLEVEALGGRPGVKSHRYATPIAGQSQDQANIEKLLGEMKSATNRNARFVCTLSLVIEGVLIHAAGVMQGSILNAPQGTHGFGYDPIVLPKGSSKSFAEMSSAEKNAISHRALALRDLMAQIKAHGLVFAKP